MVQIDFSIWIISYRKQKLSTFSASDIDLFKLAQNICHGDGWMGEWNGRFDGDKECPPI